MFIDLIKSAALIMIVIGLWIAAPVFGFIVGTGLALVFLVNAFGEESKEKDHDSSNHT